MLSSVTSWLGVTKPDSDSPNQSPVEKKSDVEMSQLEVESNVPNPVTVQEETGETDTLPSSCEKADVTSTNGNADDDQTKKADTDCDLTEDTENRDLTHEEMQKQLELDEVSQKALESAKEWGNYLYSFGKEATKQVAKASVHAAKSIKETVEDKTILGEFSKEQHKYIDDKREKERNAESAVSPWAGYNEEEAMKSQILALSLDKRNFMRNPPAGVQFNFDFESVYPVALATLREDPNLQKMRFELVPKQIKEAAFWRNYFYRVSLIKQSTQLTSLAQQTDITPPQQIETKATKSDTDIAMGTSPTENEFVSDAFQENSISEEDLKKDMLQLGMDQEAVTSEDDNIPEWEKELQAQLQEYEVVNEGADDGDIEQDILEQIEAEAKQT